MGNDIFYEEPLLAGLQNIFLNFKAVLQDYYKHSHFHGFYYIDVVLYITVGLMCSQ